MADSEEIAPFDADASSELLRRRSSEGNAMIPEFFAGRHILVTGASGFIGKVLIEKLLRCCPEIARVFVLLRPKKGKSARQRGEELCSSPAFRLVREANPLFYEKIKVVEGEITTDRLGLCDDDRCAVLETVSVVFHVAATVRFDEPLRVAVEMNLVGVQRMVELCRGMSQLKAFVHVSTAYANCNHEYIDEVIYPPAIDPESLLDMMKWLPDDAVSAVTPHLIQSMPNTYTFTKGLAEFYLSKNAGDLPIAIVRPSIVTASWKEPFPGWIDNAQGLNNMLIALGKGFLRSMVGNLNCVADVVPVDVSVNLMIAAAWSVGSSCRKAADNPKVFNGTTGAMNPLRWGELKSSATESYRKNPLNLAFRRPKMEFTANPLMNNYWVTVSHLLPAYISDMVLLLIGRKPRLVKIFGRIHKAAACVEYFTSHQWHWSNANVIDLMNQLSPEDLKMFYMDTRAIDWPAYMESYCLGTKKFILKEDLSELPRARRHMRRLQIIRYVFNTVLITMMWRFLIANSHLAGASIR